MNNQALLLEALQKENIEYRENEPLAGHTTMKIGGPARVFCQPVGTEQLIHCLQLCRQLHIEHYLLGKGSNTLFSDAGYPGAVICLGSICVAGVVYLVLVVALRVITMEDCMLLPKGEKIARILKIH